MIDANELRTSSSDLFLLVSVGGSLGGIVIKGNES